MHSLSLLFSPPESAPTGVNTSSPRKPNAASLLRASCGDSEALLFVSHDRRRAAAVVQHRVEKRTFIVSKVYYLRQVRRAHGGAEFYVSRVGRLLLHYHFDERALSRSVIADKRNALAAGDRELKPLKELFRTEGLRHIVAHEHLVGVEIRRRELRRELFGLGRLCGLLELCYALFHGKRTLMQLIVAHERPQMHLLGSACKLLYLGLILFIFPELFLKALLPLDNIKAVSAAVKLGLALAYLNAALGCLVYKIAVMAY